jgi:hypothetical protein
MAELSAPKPRTNRLARLNAQATAFDHRSSIFEHQLRPVGAEAHRSEAADAVLEQIDAPADHR